MSYISVVPLATAKDFLRIDSGNTDDDTQITAMINAACRLVERRTNYILYQRNKDYLFQNFCVFVYDYPVNSVVSPSTGVTEEKYELYNIYETNNSSDTTLTLSVGYADPADVPDDIIELILNLVKFYYYEQETNQGSKGDLPLFLKESISMLKRFII